MAALIALICSSNYVRGADIDPIAPFQRAISVAIDHFRTDGLQGPTPYSSLEPIESGLQALADRSTGGLRARALLELARTQRIGTNFTAAITNLTEAARLATTAMLADIAFDAWINAARAHVIGTHDFGAASDAIDRAEAIATGNPTQKQRFDLADIRSALYEARGEAESALIEAVAATHLAPSSEASYYASLDLAASVMKIFYRCQRRALTDTESQNDSDHRWGACKRALSATRAAYGQAGAIAEQLGWSALVENARQQGRSAETLYGLWTSSDAQIQAKLSAAGLFHPKDASSVLATQFWWGGTIADLPEARSLGPIVEQIVAESLRALGDRPDARSLALLAGRSGNDPTESARLLSQAADILQSQRHSFFDARRRGTSIEEYLDVPVSLAMQFLSLHREADAFDIFESMRARGLGELNQVLDRSDTTYATRQWLASVLLLDARASRIETKLIENVAAHLRSSGRGAPAWVLDLDAYA